MNLTELQRVYTEFIDKTTSEEWGEPPSVFLTNCDDNMTAVVAVTGDLNSNENISAAITAAVGNILDGHDDTKAVTVCAEVLMWRSDKLLSEEELEELKQRSSPIPTKIMMSCTRDDMLFSVRQQGSEGWQEPAPEEIGGRVLDFFRTLAGMVQPLLKESTEVK